MANLNIPFVILQPSQCTFRPTIETSKLISYNKYNLRNQAKPDYQEVYATWLKEEFKNHDPQQSIDGYMDYVPLQYQRFSDMTPKNLVVLGDSESGVIALCHQEWFVSKKRESADSKTKRINKFVVMLQPRVLLVPSISEEVGPVRDHCLVRSPAQHILSTSSHFLVTLHNDNRIRLWNTNDGRCVMTSQHDVLVTVGKKLRKLKSHPGHVMVLGDKGDIYIINVYTMDMLSHFAEEFTGVSLTLYKSKNFVLCDNAGKMFIWRDDSSPSPLNTVNQTVSYAVKNNSLLLESCNSDEQERFKFQLTSVIGGENGNLNQNDVNYTQQVLAIHFSSVDQIIQVHSSGIDYYLKQTKMNLHQFTEKSSKLIFAKFFTAEKRKLLLCVDSSYKVTLYDTLKLKNESTSKEPIFNANLFEDCTKFDVCEVKYDDLNKDKIFGDPSKDKNSEIDRIRRLINKQQQNDQQAVTFKFNSNQKLLFTIIQRPQKSQMITWCISSIIENLQVSLDYKNTKIPLFVNSIKLFPKLQQNCLMHFQPILSKNYYNKHQFQFFFTDETITESVTYTSMDHPCLIIGTNYGRIFMVPLFQEHEEKVLPIVLLDSHQQSPITQLFIAYNSSRKCTHHPHHHDSRRNSGAGAGGLSHHHQVNNEYERGGHLISFSANGTIAVTILNSGEIEMALHSVTAAQGEKDKRRVQQFMDSQDKNKKHRRRNSIQQDFTVHNYFHLVKAKSYKVYPYTAFDTITQVIEVLSVQELHEKIIGKRAPAKQQRRGHSPEFRNEVEQTNTNKMGERRGSADNLLGHEDLHVLDYPAYACLSKDGVVFVLKLSHLHSELVKITSLDSKAIGVYQDLDNEQLLVLTEKLNLFIYNDKSETLERKTDFKMAINTLYVRETVEYLMTMNESFKFLPKNDTSIIDFHSFEKIFHKKSLLMGHGSHKILDFLTLSLNHPLNYHPHSIYSTKYTKVMHDLLLNKVHFHEFNKHDESQKMVLRILNQAYFQNNKLYKSDYNNDYFMKQTGVSTLSTNHTFCGTKQQLVIINTKQMKAIMKQKMIRVSNQASTYGRKASNQYSEDGENFMNDKPQSSPMNKGRNPSFKKENSYRKSSSFRHPDSLVGIKWPTRLLSLVHPFNLDELIDQQMEQQFGLNLPFLDFRIGIQGTEESFSFIISKEDEHFHQDKKKVGKILNLLKMSKAMNESLQSQPVPIYNNQSMHNINTSVSIAQLNPHNGLEHDYIEPVSIFFNSEYWKISSYLSTIIPVYMFSQFVSVTEFAQQDMMKFIIQEQLYSLQKINQQKTPENANQLSMSVISKLLLKKDADISSTTRDVIMKPIIYTIDKDYLQVLMKEWQDVIIDTYKRLKKDSIKKKANQQQNHHVLNKQDSFNQINQAQNEQKLINYYFGEIEIRGLINLSQYSLHYPKILDKQIQYRVSKLTTILTREIVEKFYANKKYIYLLTALLQQLSTWIKIQDRSSKDKNIIQETIKLLLQLFSHYKDSLSKAQFISRIIGENYHLIRPNKAELYLKLTSAKTLMEIGEYQTNDFLNLIQEQAVNINNGLEYQQNVLEILRFFINSQGESLEHHLIHLTQIFIKCLDPNELVLRKNSHKLISVILSRMVNIFPMVAFHHESQRLAIGTSDGFIAIYDVRTSAKYKILEKHDGNVTCMQFDSKGNLLASYSAVDATIKLWKVGNTGFFSTIMGGTSKYSKELKMDKLSDELNPHRIIQMNKQNLLSGQVRANASQNTQDLGGGSNTSVNKCSIKFKLPKEKDVVLMRENGMEYTMRLAK